jgi:catechol-2,3-dioxygenase
MRVSGLLHYGLQVPSLDEARGFYDTFGLEVADRPHTLAVRCVGRDQDQTILTEGPDKRLHHVAFAIPLGSAADWQRHLESQNITLHDAPGPDLDGGLWFRDPDDNWITLREQELSPPRDPEPAPLNLPGDYQRTDQARWLSAGAPARPRRLGHILVFSSDNHQSETFYGAALGLRMSDRIPGKASFMNAGPGDHHVFGFVQSSHPGLHHSSWEVDTFDQLAVGAQTMAENGHRVGWGLGRHSLGSNLFHYVRDPWGSWIEYFADIDQISENWQARDWNTTPAVWCPLMPEEFLQNQEPKPE